MYRGALLPSPVRIFPSYLVSLSGALFAPIVLGVANALVAMRVKHHGVTHDIIHLGEGAVFHARHGKGFASCTGLSPSER